MVSQKTRLIFNIDNSVTVSGRKVYDMSKVLDFFV